MYPAEKLAAARRCLLAPHPKGEARSFSLAFLECQLGLERIRPEDLDDDALRCVRVIEKAMDTTGIDDSEGRGTLVVKAERLTLAQKVEVVNSVDELANWFDRRFRCVTS